MTVDQLTKRERYLRAVHGEEVDRPPVWIMRQAGRYMPAYLQMRQRHSFHDFCRKPEVSASATLLALELLDVDILIVFNDILIPLEEMGLTVEFPDSGPRITNPVRGELDISRLRAVSFDYPPVVHALKLIREKAGADIPVLGFCGSPFTLAVYAVEGEMTKNHEHIKRLVYTKPETLHTLLDLITDTAASYLIAQIQNGGADGVQLFESSGSMLASPHDYEEFAAYWQRRLIDRVKEACPDTPVHLFVKGSAGHIGSMVATGADVLSIDWSLSLADARHQTPFTLQGNLDPMVLMDEEAVETEFRKMISGFDWRRGWIANLGHGITPQASVAAARRFVRCVHELATR